MDISSENLDNMIVDTAIQILNKTENINSLGSYQLSSLLTYFVQKFKQDVIRVKHNNKIMSSVLYSHFVVYLKKSNVNDKLITYITNTKFSLEMSKILSLVRTSSGKIWENVVIDSSWRQKDINPHVLFIATGCKKQIMLDWKYNIENQYIYGQKINVSKCYESYQIDINESNVMTKSSILDFFRPFKIIICSELLLTVTDIEIFIDEKTSHKYLIHKLWLDNLIEQTDTDYIITLSNMPYFSTLSLNNLTIKINDPCNSISTCDVVNEYMTFLHLGFSNLDLYTLQEIKTKTARTPQLFYSFEQMRCIKNINEVYTFENVNCNMFMLLGITIVNHKNLTFVEIICNGISSLQFNTVLMKTVCKYNNDAIYIPFTTIENPIDLYRIDTLKVVCTFDVETDQPSIYLDLVDILTCTNEHGTLLTPKEYLNNKCYHHAIDGRNICF